MTQDKVFHIHYCQAHPTLVEQDLT